MAGSISPGSCSASWDSDRVTCGSCEGETASWGVWAWNGGKGTRSADGSVLAYGGWSCFLLVWVAGWLRRWNSLVSPLRSRSDGFYHVGQGDIVLAHLAAVFFIITFHVRSPLSIVFPSRNPPPLDATAQSSAPPSRSHSRTDSLTDPSVDVLLARKERQLQKRRLGRRLWQDLIVYVGILPVGVITMAWSTGSFFGFW